MPDSITTIDCEHMFPGHVGAFLLVEGERAAFVDNGAADSVPLLLAALAARGLRPEQVEYAMVTHAHLDHAGGTSTLLAACPTATVLAHPKAARHLISPARLIAGAKMVYGEAMYAKLYGDFPPCPAERVRTVADGEVVAWGGRALRFFHTLGHATHHLCIHDSRSNGVFTGDAFGIIHPELQDGERPYVFPVAAPPEFDPPEAKRAIQAILDTGAERFYASHFGRFDGLARRAEQLLCCLDRCEALIQEACSSAITDAALHGLVAERVRAMTIEEVTRCGFDFEAVSRHLEPDILLNTSGILVAATRRRKRRSESAEAS